MSESRRESEGHCPKCGTDQIDWQYPTYNDATHKVEQEGECRVCEAVIYEVFGYIHTLVD